MSAELRNSENVDGTWTPGHLPYWGITKRRSGGAIYWQWTVCGSRGGESGEAETERLARDDASRALARLR